eukprot:CAMPEP_0119005652 /NCGR_PEP_ID=MMETSP1176-20130426/1848_1 /TAXON_ID=265551 /ORGANISM="Synedropsis recta cf, Strain CCMP1620" /LENGTH=640 /DNA_ID=CAMNT_0006957487 /DNA_START=29 /DNA_END=1947 /DNA_ORIENTATION=+
MRFSIAAWTAVCLSTMGAQAFVQPRVGAISRHVSSMHASLDKQASSSTTKTDDWIQDDIESQAPNDIVIGPDQVLIYDTTLRDGTQGESISASCDDKVKIAKRLMAFGVDYVEAGWPGSNPKDAEFFDRASMEFTADQFSKLVAFGSTRRKFMDAKDDAQVQALLDSKAPTLCLVAKSHAWQVEEILKTTRAENLEMIYDTVQYLVRAHGRRVFVDLEHFYDGYAADPEYALACCRAAVDAGASCLVLCDTNGGSMPWQIHEATEQVVAAFSDKSTVGVHTHNDCGMAVANSLMAAKAGAGLIQGTTNGIGERTGNANLCSIIPSLALHVNTKFVNGIDLQDLTTVSRFVDELLNLTPSSAAPFVGASAFAHKGGLHVAAMERNPLSYQHIDPTIVGNEPRFLISELSGRQSIMGKMKEFGVDSEDEFGVDNTSERALAILDRVKELESKGYTFEGAEASVHLMIVHASRGYCSPFSVLDYSAQVYDTNIDSSTRVLQKQQQRNNGNSEVPSALGPTARATIKVRTLNLDDEAYDSFDAPLQYTENLVVSDGSGPIDALAKALKQALVPSHPSLKGLELVDYKVRILDPESAAGASTRVMIEFRNDNDETWTTVSVDRNIISASVNALVDGFEYALIEHA